MDVFGTAPKRRIDSRRKGAENEVIVAKLFTSWVGEPFQRVPSSGGLRWADGRGVTGDLVPPVGSPFPFLVETKHLKKVHLPNKLSARSRLLTLYEQPVRDVLRLATEKNEPMKIPLALFRENYQEKGVYYALLPEYVAAKLDLPKPITTGEFNRSVKVGGRDILVLRKICGYLSTSLFSLNYKQVEKTLHGIEPICQL